MKLKNLKNFVVCYVMLLHLQIIKAQQSIQHTVYFNNNNTHFISANEGQSLKRIIDSVSHLFEIDKISLSGHTDNKGSSGYNYDLSKLRAGSVREFLIKEGINDDKISVESKGETFPAASNKTPHGRMLNRRTEIIISLRNLPVVTETSVVEEPKGDIGQLYDILKGEPQEYCIDITRDTFLVGTRGTIIHYKANTIKSENMSCKCFTLELNEYFDKSDLILNNLTTTSDGRLLESGGMVKLDGFCDGKNYQLKPDEFFTVMIPTDTVLAGMKLLSANRNNDTDYLNWQLDPVNSDLDNFDYSKMLWACRGGELGPPAKCPFFFCKIRNFFGDLFEGRQYKNRDLRNNAESDKEKALLKKYELKGADLAIALEKSKDNSGKESLKYYVYKNYSWDYRNIDRYKDGVKFINFTIKNKPNKETDVKIIFKNSKTVVPCFEKGNSYIFMSINDNEDVWVVGLRFTVKKEIYFDLQEINTSLKQITLEFKQVSVEELKEIMKKVNK